MSGYCADRYRILKKIQCYIIQLQTGNEGPGIPLPGPAADKTSTAESPVCKRKRYCKKAAVPGFISLYWPSEKGGQDGEQLHNEDSDPGRTEERRTGKTALRCCGDGPVRVRN